MIVSDARPEDLAGITEIYNHAVANTTAIWNETTVDLQNRTKWHADRVSLGYPVIVALDDRGAPSDMRRLATGVHSTAIDSPSSTPSMCAMTSAAEVSVRLLCAS